MSGNSWHIFRYSLRDFARAVYRSQTCNHPCKPFHISYN